MGQTRADTKKIKRSRVDRLELRLEESEKQAFREAADLAGVPVSAWVRERLRRAARDELEGFGRAVPFLTMATPTPVSSKTRARIESLERGARWAGKDARAISRAACSAAVEFVTRAISACARLPEPRVGPSVDGAVSLQWGFGNVHVLVKVSSADLNRLYYQREGPGFFQEDGVMSWADVIDRLSTAHQGATE